MRKLWARLGSDITVILLFTFLCGVFYWRIITHSAKDGGYFSSGDFSDQFYVFVVFEARPPGWGSKSREAVPGCATTNPAVIPGSQPSGPAS